MRSRVAGLAVPVFPADVSHLTDFRRSGLGLPRTAYGWPSVLDPLNSKEHSDECIH